MNITPETIGYIAALLTTSSFLPQAVKTIRTRDTHSLADRHGERSEGG